MATPKERRAQREAEKLEKWQADRQKTLEKFGFPREPTSVAEVPAMEPRVAPHLQREAVKEPRTPAVGDRHVFRMTWCKSRSDQEGEWTWGDSRAWSEDEWSRSIQPALDCLSHSTWQEIEQMSARGKRGKRLRAHHGHDLTELVAEAQERWIDLSLEEFDNVFRFRVGGQKRRAWGFIVQAHFHLVWWDRTHQIFPVSKSS